MVSCLAIASLARAADRLVLRNLTVVRRTVVAFDVDGIRLDNNQRLGWDEIERGTVASKQVEFDRLLKLLGDPLYRIRQRLRVGDYKGALSHAEKVLPQYVSRRSDTAYIVFQALMWSRIAQGRSEEAVEPYLLCFECLRDKEKEPSIPGERRLRFDKQTGMSPELIPIWFDARSAKQSLPRVLRAVSAMKKPLPPAARIYYSTLALVAGDREGAGNVLAGAPDRPAAIAQWKAIVHAQAEVLAGSAGPAVTNLRQTFEKFQSPNKLVALYWLGRSKLLSKERRTQNEGLLDLTRLPAEFGAVSPRLAAAGLFEASRVFETRGEKAGARELRRELMANYGQTFFANRLRARLNLNKDDNTPPSQNGSAKQ